MGRSLAEIKRKNFAALIPPPAKQLKGLWPFPLPSASSLPPSLHTPTYCHKQAPIRQLSHHLQPYPLSIAKLGLCVPAPQLGAHKPSSAPAAVSALQQYSPPHLHAQLSKLGSALPRLPHRISPPRLSYRSPLCAATCSLHKRCAHMQRVHLLLYGRSRQDSEAEMLLDVLPLPPPPELSNSHALNQQIQLQQIPCDRTERRPDLSLKGELGPK